MFSATLLVLTSSSTSFAADDSSSPSKTQAGVVGEGCDFCNLNAFSGKIRTPDKSRFDDLLNDGSNTGNSADDKTGLTK